MVELVVNGRKRHLDCDPSTPLVLALRYDLGLPGVRAGCAVGQCGACVVLVAGDPARSCQTPVSAVDGAEVTTPEGLGTPADPHPVQQAFLDEQAAQCGYCVNGIIMSVAGLLARDPAPDEPAIQAALAGHLCRCGAHHRILRAIRRLAGHAVLPPARPPAVHDPVPAAAVAAEPAADPPALASAPRIEQWLRPLPDGRIEVRSGRVELGQGVRTALAQIVAAELAVPVDRVVVRSAATDATPDEGYTAGSLSLEQGGAALARAAAAFRRRREAGEPPTGPIEPADLPQWTSAVIGLPVPRTDLPAKLTGAAAYCHDLVLPGMVHARALLPPEERLRPAELPVEQVRELPGVLAVVHDGGLVLVVAERPEQAALAVDRLAARTGWQDPGRPAFEEAAETSLTVVADAGVDVALAGGRLVSASYAKPYEAHAPVAPSCAVAVDDGELTVWTHSQGVYPLRRELASLLGEPEQRLVVRHVDGPGCYGHNLADDAAAFAALAARAVPGRPVRFQFTVADEFGWEPYGPAMSADLAAALDDQGRIAAWQHRIRTGPHTCRPHGSGDRLIAAWLRAGGPPRPWTGGGEGGVRNADPIYDLPVRDIRADYLPSPLRTSAVRSLGAYFNIFAIESFMDELALAAGADPLAFRLRHLRDERARAVLEVAAEAADWRGAGQGLAVAQYKNRAAYVAQVVEVEAGAGRLRVRRVVTACDAGTVVNPDGLRNQLDGGTLQGLSRALHERIRPDGDRPRDWTGYPVLGFAEVPELETILVNRPGMPPLGAGEAATPVTPAALANAVHAATGVRARELPLAG